MKPDIFCTHCYNVVYKTFFYPSSSLFNILVIVLLYPYKDGTRYTWSNIALCLRELLKAKGPYLNV